MSVDKSQVLNEHWGNVGFVEGPNNDNPWGAEQGIPNNPYCDSGACMVPYHHGYRWQTDSQFGVMGCAYTPTHVNIGLAYGEVMYDHTSRGEPCDVEPLDLLFYDWNGNGEPDHVEVAVERRVGGGRTHNIGYNTGSPNGCHELWRDAKYLLCRLRPMSFDSAGPSPEPTPQPPAGRPMIRRGSVGAIVTELQQKLEAAGFNPGGVDGAFGPNTERAVREFQSANGLEVDGVVGPNTWAALDGAPPAPAPPPEQPAPPSGYPAYPGHLLTKGMSGDEVRTFQQKLEDRGWTISVDGSFGPATERVVKQFQAEKGLEVDGVVGPETWRAFWDSPIT